MRIKCCPKGNSDATYINIDHIKFTRVEYFPEDIGFPSGNRQRYFTPILCLDKGWEMEYSAYRENTQNNPLNPIVVVGCSFDTEEECKEFIKRLFSKDTSWLKNKGYTILDEIK